VIFESVDPTSGATIGRRPSLEDRALATKLEQATGAFESWRRTPLAARSACLQRLAEGLERHAPALAAMATAEMGKTLKSAVAEVQKCAALSRYYAAHAESFLQPERRADFGPGDEVRFHPLGVVLAIMPWNFPTWQTLRFALPALAAGNVGLFKPAPTTAGSALTLEELFPEAGFPSHVFQSLLADPDQVSTLIADPRVAAVTFTGSGRTGKIIAQQAGQALKKCVLELGGSDAFIVLADADVDAAASAAVEARLVCNGQSCIAAKRFLVEEPLYDAFVQRFAATMAAARVGDPRAPETTVGPLASVRFAQHLWQQVERTLAQGARAVVGGSAPLPGSAFFAPTVLVEVPWDSPAATEELFGPVAPVFRVRDRQEAFARANTTSFGLAASVWTRSEEAAQEAAEELQVGSVFINAVVASDPRFPFGGVKESGYGRELGREGLHEFVNVKTIRRPSTSP